MSENKDTHIKVIPGEVGLGGNNTPRQYRNMMADYNAKQLLNQTVELNKPLKSQRPKPKKGGCGCGK
tara:strand:+ start:457 stop:657 length:201 start_codon:yes stop_codon:yes gene_type:complete